MKAVVRNKANFQVQDVAKPKPTSHEVLIKVHSATVTAGDVFMHRIPRVAFVAIAMLGYKYKPTPGHEFAGVVEAIGDSVTRFKVGDEVFGTTTGLKAGANAEYICVPEVGKTGVIVQKPDNLSFAEAAAVPVGAMTAMHFLRKANIQPNQKVLIYGASGSVGSYAIQIAKHMGADITAVSSTHNINLMQSLGADRVIDYKQEDFSQSGQVYDVIFDAVGKTTGDQRKRAMKEDGCFVSVSSMASGASENINRVVELAESGFLKPVIDRHYDLEQITEAYQYVQSGRKKGNVIIDIA